MGTTEDALNERNEGVYRLRAIDEEMRELWPVTVDTAVRFEDLIDERQCICEALELMGVATREFNAEKDLSWLAS